MAPDELHVESRRPSSGVRPRGRRRRPRRGGRRASRAVALEARLELVGLRAQLGVGELLDLRLEAADAADLALHRLHGAALADAKDLVDEISAHGNSRVVGLGRGQTSDPIAS